MAFRNPTCDRGTVPKFVKLAGLEHGVFLQLLNDPRQRAEIVGGSQSIVPKMVHGRVLPCWSFDGQLRRHMVSLRSGEAARKERRRMARLVEVAHQVNHPAERDCSIFGAQVLIGELPDGVWQRLLNGKGGSVRRRVRGWYGGRICCIEKQWLINAVPAAVLILREKGRLGGSNWPDIIWPDGAVFEGPKHALFVTRA